MSDGARLAFPGNSLQELAHALDGAPGRVGARAAKVVRDGGNRIAREAAAAAPRRTGALASSIKVTFSGDGRSGSLSATVTPTARHAPFVEFGTYKDRPQPFLFPAFERHQDAIMRDLGNAVRDAF